MSDERPRLTVADIANLWKCCDSYVLKIIKSGALRSFGSGKMIRVRQEWLDEYECGEEANENEGSDVLKRIDERMRKSERRSAMSRRTRTVRSQNTGTGSGRETH